MKEYLPYVIVIVVSQFCLTAGAFAGFILSLFLAWLSDNVRVPLCCFLGGVAGSIIAVIVAFFVFKWIVGSDSFGWGGFLASTIPLAIPIYKDYRKSQELGNIQSEISEPRVAAFAAPTTLGMRAAVYGELVGIIVAGLIFL